MIDSMTRPHTSTAEQDVNRRLGQHLLDVVRKQDAAIPAHRRAPRTVADMLPGYERQPVLVLHRPTMADDSCPLCHRWTCDPSNCPPAPTAPAPATAGTGMQCEVCGGWFGVAPARPCPATAWVCGACQSLGN